MGERDSIRRVLNTTRDPRVREALLKRFLEIKIMKMCRRCEKTLPSDEFPLDLRNKDGLRSYCRPCNAVISKEEYYIKIDRRRRRSREYAQNHEEETRAQATLNNAIRSGEVSRPDRCSRCGRQCKPDGHHEDYSKPLDVIWLCAQCHRSSKVRT